MLRVTFHYANGEQVGFWDMKNCENMIYKLMGEARHMEEAIGRTALKVLTPSVDFGKMQ